jgi:hypothetical protein
MYCRQSANQRQYTEILPNNTCTVALISAAVCPDERSDRERRNKAQIPTIVRELFFLALVLNGD